MKKSLLSLLFVALVALPAFTVEKGGIEFVGKLGVAVNPEITFVLDSNENFSYPQNPAMAIAVEGLYYLDEALPVGLGVNYQFDSNEKFEDGYKCADGATNVYLTVKPTAKIDSEIFNTIYAIGQIGIGFNRVSEDYTCDAKSGLYWGLGAGTQIMNNFILEFVFSTNTCKYEYNGGSDDIKKTALTIYAGYKFAL